MRLLPVFLLLPFSFALAESTPRPVERVTISPGASGSIQTESRQTESRQTESRRQSQDVYGGYRVPERSSQQYQYQDNYQVQPRGGLRQSIEYPDGRVIELTPGQGASSHEGYRR